MKVLKGIFVYTMIILGAILGVGIILIGCMYLFKMPVFGYRFLNPNIKKNEFTSISLKNVTYFDNDSVETFLSQDKLKIRFVIDAGDYTVRLQPSSSMSDSISYYTLSDFTGLVKTDSKNYDAVVKQTYTTDDDGVLTINFKVLNPTGLINYDYKNNELVITVPEKYNGINFEYGFNINTTGGNIILKNSLTSESAFDAPLNVKSLSASTNKGSITLGGFSSKTVDGVKVASDEATMDDLTLSTKGGTIDFTNFKSFVIKNKLILESTKADYIFDTLTVENGMEITGSNVLVNANVIDCGGDFVYKTETGGLNINILNVGEYEWEAKTVDKNTTYYFKTPDEDKNVKLHNISIFSESTNITIGAITGKTRIENEYGKISIKNLCNQAIIKNVNGDIIIERSGVLPTGLNSGVFTDTSSIVLYNTYGSISVSEYYQNCLINNTKGKITLKTNAEKDYYTKVVTKDGNVEFSTAGSAYNIVATDKANVSIVQYAVFDSNYIKNNNSESECKTYYAKSTNGNINIVLPTSNNTTYKCRDGYIINVDGKLGTHPSSTFSSLQENTYQWYLTGSTTKPSGGVISTENIETELGLLPLIRLVGNKTYVVASD